MHYWGDEWFEKYGDQLYAAIDYVENELRKNNIFVYGKEKYGTYRNEYLRFWDGTIYQLLFKGRLYIGPSNKSKIKFIGKIQDAFHQYIYWRLDQGWTWKMLLEKDSKKRYELIVKRFEKKPYRGFGHFIRNTKFYKRYIEKKKDIFNKVFQEAYKKWPDIIDELICDIDGYEWIVPGKYGNVSGQAIHDKHWITVS